MQRMLYTFSHMYLWGNVKLKTEREKIHGTFNNISRNSNNKVNGNSLCQRINITTATAANTWIRNVTKTYLQIYGIQRNNNSSCCVLCTVAWVEHIRGELNVNSPNEISQGSAFLMAKGHTVKPVKKKIGLTCSDDHHWRNIFITWTFLWVAHKTRFSVQSFFLLSSFLHC